MQPVRAFLADWQREYRDARLRGRGTAARVVVNGVAPFVVTVTLSAARMIASEISAARQFGYAVSAFALLLTAVEMWRIIAINPEALFGAPRQFALGMSVALVPAAMIARVSLQKLVALAVVTFAVSVVLMDAVAPTFERIRRERRLTAHNVDIAGDQIRRADARARRAGVALIAGLKARATNLVLRPTAR